MDERLCVGNESSPLGDGCSDPAVHPVHPVHPVSISAGPGLLSVCSNGHGILLRPYPAYSGHIQPYLAYGEFFFQKVGGMRKKPSLAFIHRTIISLASGNGRENPVCVRFLSFFVMNQSRTYSPRPVLRRFWRGRTKDTEMRKPLPLQTFALPRCCE